MGIDLYHGKSWDVIDTWEPDQYRFDCILTDPPYGVDFQSTYGKNEEVAERYQRKIEDDQSVELAIKRFHKTMMRLAPFCAETCEMYVFSQWEVARDWEEYLEAIEPLTGFRMERLLIWEKGWPGIGNVMTTWGAGFEFIYYLKRGKRKMPYRRSGVLHVDKVQPGTNVHPTEKPTKLLKILIEMSTDPGQTVVDPYAGSASTLVAARETGRSAVGIEYDAEHYRTGMDRLSSGSLFEM